MRYIVQNEKKEYLKSYEYTDKSMSSVKSSEWSPSRMDALILMNDKELDFLKNCLDIKSVEKI